MADQGSPRRFARIDRLPPYVFNITAELRDRGRSNRARPDADGQTRLHFGDADTQDGQLAWNDGQLDDSVRGMRLEFAR